MGIESKEAGALPEVVPCNIVIVAECFSDNNPLKQPWIIRVLLLVRHQSVAARAGCGEGRSTTSSTAARATRRTVMYQNPLLSHSEAVVAIHLQSIHRCVAALRHPQHAHPAVHALHALAFL
jgi:hypothetical protein